MKVNGFKLLSNGMNGIEADVIDSILKNNVTVFRPVKIKQELPAPTSLREKTQALKYYLLVLSGHWQPEWDALLKSNKSDIELTEDVKKHFSSGGYKRVVSLMDNTTVVGVFVKGASFYITGKIKTLGEKVVNITTPLCSFDDDDDYQMYDETIEKIQEIFGIVQTFLYSSKLEIQNPREYLKEAFKAAEDKSRFESMTDEEAEQEALEFLASRNFISIKEDDIDVEEEEKEDEEEVIVESEEVVSVEQEDVSDEEIKLEKEEIVASTDEVEW